MNTPPPFNSKRNYKYRRPLPAEPCPTPNSKRKASAETPPPSLKRAHIPDGKNPITPQRASLYLKDVKSPMSTLTDATIMASMKQRKHQTPQKKGFSQVPAPSTYHLSSAADPKTPKASPLKDPRLASHPPALLPARQVDSSMEYKASGQANVSPDAKHKSPPKIPGPAKAPAGRGYEHQRREPPPHQMSTMPLPFSESKSALRKGAEMNSFMMRSNPTARGPPQPHWRPGMVTPPRKNPTQLTPSSTVPSPASLGPKARGMPGRQLFGAETNKMEQQRERLARQREEEQKKRRREEAKEARRRKELEEVRQKAEISDDDDSGDENYSIPVSNPNSSLNFGMNTAKRMFGTAGSQRPGMVGVKHFKKGFKPPPPPGRPAAKVSMPAPIRGQAPQPSAEQRPPASMLSSKRSANQKPEEMLNHGWWRFTDPSTQFQYFWNEVTNESQYERPDEFSTVKEDIFASARNKAEKGNEGWVRYTDDETKMHYFYKASTDEGQWERPINFETVKGGFTAAQLTDRRSALQLPVEADDQWVKYVDPDSGYAYYYNEITYESTYDRPTGMTTNQDPFSSVREGGGQRMVPAAALTVRRDERQLPVEKLNGGWVKYVDPESGHPYYYHEENDESTYDRPKGFETVANPFASVRSSGNKRSDIGPRSATKMSARRNDEQLPVEKLNGGWEKFVDPDSGHPYYFNEDTGESTFDKPSGFVTAKNPFTSTRSSKSAVSAAPSVPAGVLSVRRDEEQRPVEKLNGGWQKFVDPESGHPYYYHEESDESAYERPSGFATVADPFSSTRSTKPSAPTVPAGVLSVRRDEDQMPVEKLNGGWMKYVDPESGHPYYYHEESDESTYERPSGFSTVADPFGRGVREVAEINEASLMPPASTLSTARSESQMPVEKLNGGWVKYVDPESNHPYYYHKEKDESTYERPDGFVTVADPFKSTSDEGRLPVMPLASALSTARSKIQKPVEILNGGWVKYVDPESRHPYYYHEGKDESTYERPDGFSTIADPFNSARGDGSVMPPASALSSARSQNQRPEEQLNGGWVKYVDPESGHPYYYHEEMDESTYERPNGFATILDPFNSARDEGVMPPASTLSSARSHKQKPEEKLNGGWVKYVDPESGHPYFYNESTEESTYERPSGFSTAPNPFSSARSVLPPASTLTARRDASSVGVQLNGGWVKYIDPETNYPYYYHEADDVSQYERPSGFVTSMNPFGTVKSRRNRAAPSLAGLAENCPTSPSKVAIGSSLPADNLDQMMATFNRGSAPSYSSGTPSSVPTLGLPRSSAAARRTAKNLLNAEDVLSAVNDKLGGLSIDELKAQRDGGSGIMDTYSKKESGRRSSREQQPGVPAIQNFGRAVSGGGDSLDNMLQSAPVPDDAGASWLEASDRAEKGPGGASVFGHSSLASSSSLAPSLAISSAPDETAGDWVEYFDEEVGAKYYYNERTGEASWVNPNSM